MVTFEVKANRDSVVKTLVCCSFPNTKKMKQKRFYTVKRYFNKSNQ